MDLWQATWRCLLLEALLISFGRLCMPTNRVTESKRTSLSNYGLVRNTNSLVGCTFTAADMPGLATKYSSYRNDRAFSADECPLAMRWTIFGTRIERQFCYRDRCSASFSLQHCVLFGSNDNSSHSSSFPGQLEASWRSSRFQCWKKWN